MGYLLTSIYERTQLVTRDLSKKLELTQSSVDNAITDFWTIILKGFTKPI